MKYIVTQSPLGQYFALQGIQNTGSTKAVQYFVIRSTIGAVLCSWSKTE